MYSIPDLRAIVNTLAPEAQPNSTAGAVWRFCFTFGHPWHASSVAAREAFLTSSTPST